MASPELWFYAGLDTSDYEEALRRMQRMTEAVAGSGADVFRRSNSQVLADMDKSVGKLQQYGAEATRLFKDLSRLAGFALPTMGIMQFLSRVKEVRADFQDIESTMRTFLGSAEKAADFVDRLKEAAYYNMFEFKDLVEGSKQMIAYGVSVDQVIPRLNELSEIATATHASLGQMVSMYNRAKSIGYVDSRSMQTWASQGLVIKDVLRQMGENANVTKVSFDQLNKVLDHVTGEGGMFHGIMDSQMQNISAEVGQLQDNLTTMFDDIGREMEGPIHEVVSLAAQIVEHWKEVAWAIGAATAGTFAFKAGSKAAANEAKEELGKLREEVSKGEAELRGEKAQPMDKRLEMLVKGGKLTEEEAQEEMRLRVLKQQLPIRKQLKEALEDEAENMRSLVEAEKARGGYEETLAKVRKEGRSGDPVLDAKSGYDYELRRMDAIIDAKRGEAKALETRSKALEDKAEEMWRKAERLGEEAAKHEKEYEELARKSQDIAKYSPSQRESFKEKAEKAKDLAEQADEAATALNLEKETLLEEANTLATQANTVAGEANTLEKQRNAVAARADAAAVNAETQAKNVSTAATAKESLATRLATQAKLVFRAAVDQVRNSFLALKAAMMTNPLGILLTGLTTALALLPLFSSDEEEASDETERFGESALKTRSKVERLYATLESSKENSKTYNDALRELQNTCREYGVALKGEIDLQDELISKRERLIMLIQEEGRQRQIAAAQEKARKEKEKLEDKLKSQINDNLKDKGVSDEDMRDDMAEMIAEAVVMDEGKLKEAYDTWQGYVAETYEALRSGDSDTWAEASEKRDAAYAAYLKRLKGIYAGAQAYSDSMGLGLTLGEDINDEDLWRISQYELGIRKVNKATEARTKALGASQAAVEANTDADENWASKSATDVVAALQELYEKKKKVEEQPATAKVEAEGAKEAAEEVKGAEKGLSDIDGKKTKISVDAKEVDEASAKVEKVAGQIAGMPVITITSRFDSSPVLQNIPQAPQKSPEELLKEINDGIIDGKKALADMLPKGGSADDVSGAVKSFKEMRSKMKPTDPLYGYLNSLILQGERMNPDRYLESDGGAGRRFQAAEARRQEQRRLGRLAKANAFEEEALDISRREDGYDKEKAQADLDRRKKLQSLEEKTEDEMEALRKRRRSAWAQSAPGLKESEFSDDWTQEQYRQAAEENIGFAVKAAQIEADALKALHKVEDGFLEQRRSFMQEYGSQSEKLAAIEEEYAEKIERAAEGGDLYKAESLRKERQEKLDQAKNEWAEGMEGLMKALDDYESARKSVNSRFDRLSAQRPSDPAYQAENEAQRRQQLDALAMEKLASETGMEAIFENLATASEESIGKLKEKLKDALELPDLSAQNKAKLMEMLDQLADETDRRGSVWRKVFSQNSLPGIIAAAKDSKERREKAAEREQYFRDEEKGYAEEQRQAEETAGAWRSAALAELADEARAQLEDLDDGMFAEKFAEMLAAMDEGETKQKLQEKFGNFLSAEGKAADAAAKKKESKEQADKYAAQKGASPDEEVSAAKVVDEINKNIQSTVALVKELGLEETAFGEGVAYFAESASKANAAWQSFQNGDFVGAAANAIGALGSLGDALGSWGFAGFGSSDPELKNDLEKLQAANDALRKSIDRLSDTLGDYKMNEWPALMRRMVENENEMLANSRQAIRRSADEHSDGFLGIGGKHSTNYAMGSVWDSINARYGSLIRELIGGKQLSSITDILNLTSEELDKLMTFAPQVWAQIIEGAKKGKNDVSGMLEEYADEMRKSEELRKANMERLTGTTSSAMREQFVSDLADMGKEASAFADDFQEMLYKAVLNAKVSDVLKDHIDKFYEHMYALAEASGGEYSQADVQKLSDEWAAITEKGLALRDLAAAVTGYDDTYNQSATAGGFATATQDSVNELNGRFLAVQMLCTDMRDSVAEIKEQGLARQQAQARAQEGLDILQYYSRAQLDELQAISKNTSELYQMNERLAEIERHTRNLE